MTGSAKTEYISTMQIIQYKAFKNISNSPATNRESLFQFFRKIV